MTHRYFIDGEAVTSRYFYGALDHAKALQAADNMFKEWVNRCD